MCHFVIAIVPTFVDTSLLLLFCPQLSTHFVTFCYNVDKGEENMEEYRFVIGTHLKELRNSKNMSQRALSAKSGVSDSAISYYENGRPIDVDVLNKLCTALNIDMLVFLDECKEALNKGH